MANSIKNLRDHFGPHIHCALHSVCRLNCRSRCNKQVLLHPEHEAWKQEWLRENDPYTIVKELLDESSS